MEEVRDRLNQKLRGWEAYFELGSTARAYRAIDEYVEERVRYFLRRRHKVSTQGTRRFLHEPGVWQSWGCFAFKVR